MKRRNQASRRRAYGRRQHEVRQRRPADGLIDRRAWYDEGLGEHGDFGLGSRQQGDVDQRGQAAA